MIRCTFIVIFANLLITALNIEGFHDGWQSTEKRTRNQQKSRPENRKYSGNRSAFAVMTWKRVQTPRPEHRDAALNTSSNGRMMNLDVRWEKRDAESDGSGRRTRLVASLVEAVQENGIKRNRVIANLGAIEMRFLNVAIKCTREFHQGLCKDPRLEELEGLARVALCKVAFEANQLQRSDSKLDERAYTSQSWHAEMIYDCDRYLAF